MWHKDEIRGLWIWWVGGHAALAVICVVLAALLAPLMVFAIVLVVLFGLALGAMLGWVQKQALERCKLLPVAVVERWFWRTVQAWIAAHIVSQVVDLLINLPGVEGLSGELKGLTVILVFGAVFGIMQWDMLRGHITAAGWWIAATVSGWLLGPICGSLALYAASGLVNRQVQNSGGYTEQQFATISIGLAVLVASTIAVYGLVTGSVMAWLVSKSEDVLDAVDNTAPAEY